MLRGFLCTSTSSFSFSTLAPFNSATCREDIWKTDFKTLPVQKESFQKYQIIYYLPKLTCSLFLMKMKVGMAVILYSAATSSMSSTSTWHRSYTINQTDNEAVRLTKLQLQLLNFKMEKTLMKTTSSSVLFNSSRTGAIILHGPHLIKSRTIITALHINEVITRLQKSQQPPVSPQPRQAEISSDEIGLKFQGRRLCTWFLKSSVSVTAWTILAAVSTVLQFTIYDERKLQSKYSIWEKNINLRGLLMTKQSLGMQQLFLWLMERESESQLWQTIWH